LSFNRTTPVKAWESINGITNIEIEGDKIRLIKWKKNKSLPLERRRKILWKEKSLSEIRRRIGSKNNAQSVGSLFDGNLIN